MDGIAYQHHVALQKKLQVKNVPSATCEEEQKERETKIILSHAQAKWESLSGSKTPQHGGIIKLD